MNDAKLTKDELLAQEELSLKEAEELSLMLAPKANLRARGIKRLIRGKKIEGYHLGATRAFVVYTESLVGYIESMRSGKWRDNT